MGNIASILRDTSNHINYPLKQWGLSVRTIIFLTYVHPFSRGYYVHACMHVVASSSSPTPSYVLWSAGGPGADAWWWWSRRCVCVCVCVCVFTFLTGSEVCVKCDEAEELSNCPSIPSWMDGGWEKLKWSIALSSGSRCVVDVFLVLVFYRTRKFYTGWK